MNSISTESLATALPQEITRVRQVQDEFKALRGMKNVLVEPQIAMMERDIRAAVEACASGNVIAMLQTYEALKGWSS
jgi:hypothetical protein